MAQGIESDNIFSLPRNLLVELPLELAQYTLGSFVPDSIKNRCAATFATFQKGAKRFEGNVSFTRAQRILLKVYETRTLGKKVPTMLFWALFPKVPIDTVLVENRIRCQIRERILDSFETSGGAEKRDIVKMMLPLPSATVTVAPIRWIGSTLVFAKNTLYNYLAWSVMIPFVRDCTRIGEPLKSVPLVNLPIIWGDFVFGNLIRGMTYISPFSWTDSIRYTFGPWNEDHEVNIGGPICAILSIAFFSALPRLLPKTSGGDSKTKKAYTKEWQEKTSNRIYNGMRKKIIAKLPPNAVAVLNGKGSPVPKTLSEALKRSEDSWKIDHVKDPYAKTAPPPTKKDDTAASDETGTVHGADDDTAVDDDGVDWSDLTPILPTTTTTTAVAAAAADGGMPVKARGKLADGTLGQALDAVASLAGAVRELSPSKKALRRSRRDSQ